MRWLTGLLLALVLVACKKDKGDVEYKRLIVASETATYINWGGQSTWSYKTKEAAGDEWTVGPKVIEGFDYEPGFEYVIDVRITRLPGNSCIDDCPGKRYQFVKQISKKIP